MILEKHYGRNDAFLGDAFDEEAAFAPLCRSETTGWPIGPQEWIKQLERGYVRPLTPHKRGPKPQERQGVECDNLFSKLSP